MNATRVLKSFHDQGKAARCLKFNSCVPDADIQGRYQVLFSVLNPKGEKIFDLPLPVDLDREQFNAAVGSLTPPTDKDLDAIFRVRESMDNLMKMRAFDLIQHLASYNGVADDYAAIARLAQSENPRISAGVYGI